MTRFLFAALVLVSAPVALAQSPRPVPGGAGASVPVLHEGRVVFAALGSGGASRLVRLDPATGRTTETPLPGFGTPHTWDVYALAGTLYAGAMSEEYERTPWQAVDAAGRLRPVPEPLASMNVFDLSYVVDDGARALGVENPEDDDSPAGRLVAFAPGGAATPLEPLPAPVERNVSLPTALGDAVYYVVQTLRENGTNSGEYIHAVWRTAGGTAAPLDVLPPGVATHNTGLVAVGGALLISTIDRTVDAEYASRLWRLAPGAARAMPVTGVSVPTDLSQEYLRGFGDTVLFTMSDDEMRVRLWRVSGTSAPVQVGGLDLGHAKTFFTETVRVFDGAVYVWGFSAGADGAPTRLYRVDPAAGAAREVARYRGSGFPRVSNLGDRFVVAGGRVYFVLAGETDDGTLVSLPVDTAAPAAPRRSTRRRR